MGHIGSLSSEDKEGGVYVFQNHVHGRMPDAGWRYSENRKQSRRQLSLGNTQWVS